MAHGARARLTCSLGEEELKFKIKMLFLEKLTELSPLLLQVSPPRNHELVLPTPLSSWDFNIRVFSVQLLSSGGTELRCWNPGLQSDSQSKVAGQCGGFSSRDCLCPGGVAAGCRWQDKEAADDDDEIQRKWSVIPGVVWDALCQNPRAVPRWLSECGRLVNSINWGVRQSAGWACSKLIGNLSMNAYIYLSGLISSFVNDFRALASTAFVLAKLTFQSSVGGGAVPALGRRAAAPHLSP